MYKLLLFVLGIFLLAAVFAANNAASLSHIIVAQNATAVAVAKATQSPVELQEAANLACRGFLIETWGIDNPRFEQGFSLCVEGVLHYTTNGRWPSDRPYNIWGGDAQRTEIYDCAEGVVLDFIGAGLIDNDARAGNMVERLTIFLDTQGRRFK
jgi:hypothetical protein